MSDENAKPIYTISNISLYNKTTGEVSPLDGHITLAPKETDSTVFKVSDVSKVTFEFVLYPSVWYRMFSWRAAWERTLARRRAENESRN